LQSALETRGHLTQQTMIFFASIGVEAIAARRVWHGAVATQRSPSEVLGTTSIVSANADDVEPPFAVDK
jgi:hypothetical protein